MATETIFNRTFPCRCGCQGQDPWHASKFKRVLRNVEDFVGDVVLREDNHGVNSLTYRAVQRATARFPWGDNVVYRLVVSSVRNGEMIDIGWWTGA